MNESVYKNLLNIIKIFRSENEQIQINFNTELTSDYFFTGLIGAYVFEQNQDFDLLERLVVILRHITYSLKNNLLVGKAIEIVIYKDVIKPHFVIFLTEEKQEPIQKSAKINL